MRARDLLSEDQLADVRDRHDWKAAALIAHAWATIFAAMALFTWWPNVLTFVPAGPIVRKSIERGRPQSGLANAS
jgi:hypothetical protein